MIVNQLLDPKLADKWRNALQHENFMLVVGNCFDNATTRMYQDSVERQRIRHMAAVVMNELTRPEWNS